MGHAMAGQHPGDRAGGDAQTVPDLLSPDPLAGTQLDDRGLHTWGGAGRHRVGA
jgi:hypothetical protein